MKQKKIDKTILIVGLTLILVGIMFNISASNHFKENNKRIIQVHCYDRFNNEIENTVCFEDIYSSSNNIDIARLKDDIYGLIGLSGLLLLIIGILCLLIHFFMGHIIISNGQKKYKAKHK